MLLEAPPDSHSPVRPGHPPDGKIRKHTHPVFFHALPLAACADVLVDASLPQRKNLAVASASSPPCCQQRAALSHHPPALCSPPRRSRTPKPAERPGSVNSSQCLQPKSPPNLALFFSTIRHPLNACLIYLISFCWNGTTSVAPGL